MGVNHPIGDIPLATESFQDTVAADHVLGILNEKGQYL